MALDLEPIIDAWVQTSPEPWVVERTTSAGKVFKYYRIPGLDVDETGQSVWENMRCVDQHFIAYSKQWVREMYTEILQLRAELQTYKDANNATNLKDHR